MTNGRVTGVRSIELGVRDLHQSAEFYAKVWALEEVSSDGDSIHFRATGGEHHVLTIRERAKPACSACISPPSIGRRSTSSRAKAKGYGVEVGGAPGPLSGAAGGGYGFRFHTPDGLPMSISSDIVQHPNVVLDRSRPTKISHVVLNSARTEDQVPFFIDVLGFKLSDSSHMMEFLRCSADHHSIAIFRNNGPSLNHVAYELPSIDGLMRGTGRLKQNGFDIEWGVGRHGPGNNVFSYFIEPNGFVAEYTTELDQLDDATHVPQDGRLLAKVDARPRTAGAPPDRRQTGCGPPCRARSISARSRPASAARTSSGASSGDLRITRPDHLLASDDIPFDKRFDLPPGKVEEVAPGVRRLLVDNPGPFTFKGTRLLYRRPRTGRHHRSRSRSTRPISRRCSTPCAGRPSPIFS